MKLSKLITILMFGIAVSINAQNGPDQLFMNNGETYEVTVKKVEPKTITYVFFKEKMENVVEKDKVVKIVFHNGREQLFGASNSTSPQTEFNYPEMNTNEGAILPFVFIFDGQPVNEEGVEAQEYYYNNVMRKPERNTISYQDPELTQRRLRKAGIADPSQYKDYDMQEIAKILGVGVVVTGKITVDFRSTTTNSYGSTTVKANDKKKKVRAYSSDYSTSQDEFDTKVLFRIYDKDGKKVVDVTRRPFMAITKDNYITALGYLMKRTPYYRKK